jgi:GTP cyclohydrolase IA
MSKPKKFLTNNEVQVLASAVVKKIHSLGILRNEPLKLFPVPRGGIPALYAMLPFFGYDVEIATRPEHAHVIVDDIIASGATKERYACNYPHAPFVALVDQIECESLRGSWIIFPWEATDKKDDSFADNITRLLQFIGEDPTRGGLLETPTRVVKAWEEWTSGYGVDPKTVLKTFKDGSDSCDQIILVRDIPFYSHCEHHLAPFFGTAHVGYIPNGSIVGLSKLPAIVDVFAKRLQVQERLTNQIADAIWDNLKPKAVGVVLSARHLCMESRGKKKIGSSTVTSALRGTMLNEPDCRSEFFNLIKL